MAKEKVVLLAEDDEMISGMYNTKLTQEGYKVVLAGNGADAITLAKENNPDIVLLDIIMPQLDGFSVLQELRSSAKFKNTPIIMLTNLGTEEDKQKGADLGATDYLVKASLTPAQVKEAIEKYLK